MNVSAFVASILLMS